MKWAKRLIIALCITMFLLICAGLGEEQQVYQLNEDCPAYFRPGDTETSIVIPKGNNVEVFWKTAFEGEDWSLLLSSDGTFGYVRSASLLIDEVSMKVDILDQEMKIQVGDILTFGQYEQDNNTTNGPEKIEWIVLDVQDGKCLLLSRYGLDAQPYNKEFVDTTWQTCTLRKWLNEEFMNNAFTAQDQTKILMTDADNGNGQGYREWEMSGGDNTQDKIFLLSYAEANKYLGVSYENYNNIESRTAPTAYAILCGAPTASSNKTTDGTASGWWWLRSPGSRQSYAALIDDDGSLSNNFVYIEGCVRPALWISLEQTFPEAAVTESNEIEDQVSLPADENVHEERIDPYKTIGSIVTFGRYEQDNNTANGPEKIEWIVLDVQDGKCLLLSKYGLDVKAYNDKYKEVSWVSCSLRKWLNSIFMDNAFSEEEKKKIDKTIVDNDSDQKYSGYSTYGGSKTVDMIFLLSYAEANKYLGVGYYDRDNMKSRAAPTAYAIQRGGSASSVSKTEEGRGACWWWLRSPGLYQHDAAYVHSFGSLRSYSVNYGIVCIRPALWIDLESDIF